MEYNDEIRKISFDLLKNKVVDVVIGFCNGTIPMVNRPCIIKKPTEVDSLIWDSNCRINLTNYITNRNDKIGIITKGCDSRNIVTHITENKIERSQLYIIGIPCNGMVDRKKIRKLFSKEIISTIESKDYITLESNDGTKESFDKKNIMQDNCMSCAYPNPVISDIIVGNKIEKNSKNIDKFSDIKEIEKKDTKNRNAYFDESFSNCIRCYACREVCPLCYCPTCFVDESNPQWLGKSTDINDVKIFHFLRAYHCSGRCTECGSCEQVCTLEVNMRILTRKLMMDCKNKFNWEAGISNKIGSPLNVYNINDPDDFIK